MGVSILQQLIIKRVPYNIVKRELYVPAYRNIGIAFREKRTLSLAVKRFLDYLDFRCTEK